MNIIELYCQQTGKQLKREDLVFCEEIIRQIKGEIFMKGLKVSKIAKELAIKKSYLTTFLNLNNCDRAIRKTSFCTILQICNLLEIPFNELLERIKRRTEE